MRRFIKMAIAYTITALSFGNQVTKAQNPDFQKKGECETIGRADQSIQTMNFVLSKGNIDMVNDQEKSREYTMKGKGTSIKTRTFKMTSLAFGGAGLLFTNVKRSIYLNDWRKGFCYL